jgi:hypothetical protein
LNNCIFDASIFHAVRLSRVMRKASDASGLGGIAVGLLSHGHKCFPRRCLFGIQFDAGLFSLDERGSIYGAENFLDEKGPA